MRLYYNQASLGTEPSVITHYLYDAGGNRVKKLTRVSGGNWESITYIDGLIEYREDQDHKIQTISHIMDDSKRVATVRTGNLMGDGTPAIKYNLDDHLGSSNVSVDENGTLVNREEYYPFGETSFGSYSKKRYRFCSKEKDEESGLYYYGARYYSPWTCRFISVDPLAGKYPFYTAYQYAGNQPINFIDLDGMEPVAPPTPASNNGGTVGWSTTLAGVRTPIGGGQTPNNLTQVSNVVIDPGHGGNDPGATARTGQLNEADINLLIAQSVQARLAEKNAQYVEQVNVTMTRTTNSNPGGTNGSQTESLQARTNISQAANPALFVSIHVNSATNTNADAVHVITQPSTQTANSNQISQPLVNNAILSLTGVTITNHGVSQTTQNLAVLRAQPYTPGVLIEVGFITNPTQETNLNDQEYLNSIGIAIADAIWNTLYPNPVLKTSFKVPTPPLILPKDNTGIGPGFGFGGN